MAHVQSLLARVTARRDALSRAERKVADWILANPRRSVELSIADMAATANVSEPTVVRFCRSLGLTGYRDFKTKLIANLHRPENYLHHDVSSGDSPTDAVGKVLDGAIRALVDLRDHTSTMPFERAVRALSAARQLIFAGVGASGHVARDAQHKFFRLGVPCSTALDAQTILQCAAIASPGDAFVAISHTGTWPELVGSMHLARSRGATVIAITDPHAPLSNAADLVFPCHPAEDTSVFTPMSSRLNHLALLDALQVGLALEIGPQAEDNLRLSKDALLDQRAVRQKSAVGENANPTSRVKT